MEEFHPSNRLLAAVSGYFKRNDKLFLRLNGSERSSMYNIHSQVPN